MGYDYSEAGLAVVGLFAAWLSTTNAQIFALGNELRSLLPGNEKSVMRKTKVSLLMFAGLVMVFALVMGDQLALLARVSFTGTSMMAPVVLAEVLMKTKPGKKIIVISFVALCIFITSVAGLVPAKIGMVRLDILLYAFLVPATVISILIRRGVSSEH